MMATAAERMSSRIVVGISDAAFSNDPARDIVTYALGSCIAVAIYDPEVGIGGLVHCMLPDSRIAPEKAASNPWMFVDTGVPALFKEAYRRGAVKERLRVYGVGGASVSARAQSDTEDSFQIGKRNVTMLRKLLWKNGVLLAASELGGEDWRTVTLRMDTGEVFITSDAAKGG